MRRKILAIALALCFAMLPMTVAAAQEMQMICWTQSEPEKLSMLLVSQEEAGSYSATLDGKALTLKGGTVAEEGIPITVYCLVDTSGSISNFKMNLIRDTLETLSASMGSSDNMILATVDNTVTESKPLCSAEARSAAISTIAASHKDTNLYAGIVAGLNRLASATDLNPARMLVILSDGIDQQDNGMTEQEVRDTIAKTRLPIFTVALVEGYAERTGAKVLGSFSRSSCGGMHLTTVNEGSYGDIRQDVSGQEFGSTIWKAVSGYQYLTADLKDVELDSTRAELRLSVSYNTGNSSYVDSVTVDATALEAVPVAETAPTEEPEPEPDPDSVPEPATKPYVWICAGAAVLVLVVAAVLVIKKKKKPADTVIQEETDTGETKPLNDSQDTGETKALADSENAGETKVVSKSENSEETKLLQDSGNSERPLDVIPAPALVELVDIPDGEHPCKFQVRMDEPAVFGRNQKADHIIDAKDSKLSGRHFALLINKDLVCIRDMGSTNGTFLNGIRISDVSWTKMESDDKVRAGSREYRLTIRFY